MNTSHSSNQRVIEKCRLLIVLVMNIFLPIPHIKSGYLLWYMLHEENTNKKPTIRPRYRIVQSMNSWLIMKQSKVPAESDGKPVDEQSWFHNSNISLVSVVLIILDKSLLVEIMDLLGYDSFLGNLYLRKGGKDLIGGHGVIRVFFPHKDSSILLRMGGWFLCFYKLLPLWVAASEEKRRSQGHKEDSGSGCESRIVWGV